MLRSGASSLLRAFTSLSVTGSHSARPAAGQLNAVPGAARSLYFSGSHYDKEHMKNAKNPDLAEDPGCAAAQTKIFGTAKISNPHNRSVRKLLLANPVGKKMAEYYPKELRHNHGGIYEDPFYMRRQEQLARLGRRGKGPPKKGQGKRSKVKGK